MRGRTYFSSCVDRSGRCFNKQNSLLCDPGLLHTDLMAVHLLKELDEKIRFIIKAFFFLCDHFDIFLVTFSALDNVLISRRTISICMCFMRTRGDNLLSWLPFIEITMKKISLLDFYKLLATSKIIFTAVCKTSSCLFCFQFCLFSGISINWETHVNWANQIPSFLAWYSW